MQLQNELPAASDEDFANICKVLTQSPERRKEFLLQPERVLSEEGIKVNSKSLEVITKIVNDFCIDGEKTEFNEKLVLCSSSGH